MLFRSSNQTDAYKGVNLRINNGVDVGEVVTITSYNPTTKVATIIGNGLANNFIRTPETNCNFSLIFDTKDFESLYNGISALNVAHINQSSKVNGLDSGDVFFSNVGDEELIYETHNNFLVQGYIKNVSYYSWMKISNQSVDTPISIPNPKVAIFNVGDDTLTPENANENFVLIVKDPGNSGFNVGDIVPLTDNTTITVTTNSTQAIIRSNALQNAYVDVYAKVFIEQGKTEKYSYKTKDPERGLLLESSGSLESHFEIGRAHV